MGQWVGVDAKFGLYPDSKNESLKRARMEKNSITELLQSTVISCTCTEGMEGERHERSEMWQDAGNLAQGVF